MPWLACRVGEAVHGFLSGVSRLTQPSDRRVVVLPRVNKVRFPMLSPRPLIALVDDDEAVLNALRRLLRACGLRAETFASGRAFLDSLADHLPDCVILDVRMPDLSGWEVQAELITLGLPLPLIFMTAHADAAAQERALSNGAVAFLRKPVTAQRLLEAIEVAMRAAGEKRGRLTRAKVRLPSVKPCRLQGLIGPRSNSGKPHSLLGSTLGLARG
ncbi:MAG: response regulator [Chromatiales bacterium]|nr:response regulator [Chromatiales bacterium]